MKEATSRARSCRPALQATCDVVSGGGGGMWRGGGGIVGVVEEVVCGREGGDGESGVWCKRWKWRWWRWKRW